MEWLWLILAAVAASGLYLWSASNGINRRLGRAQRQSQDEIAKTLGAGEAGNQGGRPW